MVLYFACYKSRNFFEETRFACIKFRDSQNFKVFRYEKKLKNMHIFDLLDQITERNHLKGAYNGNKIKF